MASSRIIDGVPTLGWGKGRDCTFIGALEAALAVTGHPFSYSDMMGWSGLAFRARWFYWDGEPAWCPSSAVGEFPEPMAAVEKATGWRQRCVVRFGREQPHMEELAPDIVASIDAGLPVLAYEPLRLPPAELGPMTVFLDRYDAPLSRTAALAEALRIAIHGWERGTGDGGRYWYGEAALEHWAADIANAGALTDSQCEKLFGVSLWCFTSLADARKSGAWFLQENGLESAATMVREEADTLQAVLDEGPAFQGWWTGKTLADWTPQVREAEYQVLSDVRLREDALIAELKRDLASIG